MLATQTATNLVDLTFTFGLKNAINAPTVMAVAIIGLISGLAIAVALNHARTPVPPVLVASLSSSLLVALQAGSLIGASIYAPTNTGAYAGGHIGYVALSILCGTMAGAGVWLWGRRDGVSHD